MYHFKDSIARDLYRRQLMSLLDEGDDVHVRGFDTFEHLNVITEITNPLEHVICVPGRIWNPWLALSEAVWILGGRKDTRTLEPYNKRIIDFSDDGVSLYGAYGFRMRHQIQDVIDRLKLDKNDRRAVIAIWNEQDLMAISKDPPCNDMVMFKIRQNQLHMTVINRSNDIHWGLYAVNLTTFGILQEYIAKQLGVSIGTQTHLSNSLHVYLTKEAEEITYRMCQAKEDPPEIPDHYGLFSYIPRYNLPPHFEFRKLCWEMLEHSIHEVFPFECDVPFLEFVDDFLRIYREKNWKELQDARHAEYYQDWIFAANYWLEERNRYRAEKVGH